jgi:hypothetical protein
MIALREMLKFKLWSNVFYLAPFAMAVYWQLWPTALLALCVASFGMLFHFYREKRYLLPDSFSAWLLIFTNLVLCYLGGFQAPYFWIALLFLLFALFYHFYPWKHSEYNLNHGLWHLYGALITLFCIFTYIL